MMMMMMMTGALDSGDERTSSRTLKKIDRIKGRGRILFVTERVIFALNIGKENEACNLQIGRSRYLLSEKQ